MAAASCSLGALLFGLTQRDVGEDSVCSCPVHAQVILCTQPSAIQSFARSSLAAAVAACSACLGKRRHRDLVRSESGGRQGASQRAIFTGSQKLRQSPSQQSKSQHNMLILSIFAHTYGRPTSAQEALSPPANGLGPIPEATPAGHFRCEVEPRPVRCETRV